MGKTKIESPPEDIAAEQSVLGAMLIEKPAIDVAADILSRADFSRLGHRIIFDSILALHRRGKPVDLVTLPPELTARGELENIGGKLYLTSLFDTVPTAANVVHYAKIVQNKAHLRQLMAVGQTLSDSATSPGANVLDVITRIQQSLSTVSENAMGGQTSKSARRIPLDERLIDMREAWAQEVMEPPRLFGDILIKRCQTILSAPSGVGKTTLVLNIVTHLAEGNSYLGMTVPTSRKVLMVDLETPDFLRTSKLQKLYRDSEPVQDQLFFLPEINLPADLPQLLRVCEEREIELVVFDTASRSFPRADENSSSEVYEKVTPILDSLKAAGVASLTIAHTGKRGPGTRGASAFEDAVDIVLSLEIPFEEKHNPDAILTLTTIKNRVMGFPEPISLQRTGNDSFKLLSPEEFAEASQQSKSTNSAAKPTASDKCAADILAFIQAQEKPPRFKDITDEMVKCGHALGTAKRVVSDLQKDGKISHNLDSGYYLEPQLASS